MSNCLKCRAKEFLEGGAFPRHCPHRGILTQSLHKGRETLSFVASTFSAESRLPWSLPWEFHLWLLVSLLSIQSFEHILCLLLEIK